MKGMDIFCASPASTAIISGRRRHGAAILRRQTSVPCSSHLPISPRPSTDGEKRSSRRRRSAKENDFRRKSSADDDDLRRRTGSSARYLLMQSSDHFHDHEYHDKSGDELLHGHHHHRELVISSELSAVKSINDSVRPLRLTPSRSNRSQDQVVVLKVAIHCKGCEGKVRRHISKMEGVKSFNIELATKKVTIMGDVNPLGVLESVSKVKRAQFWVPSSLHDHQTTCN